MSEAGEKEGKSLESEWFIERCSILFPLMWPPDELLIVHCFLFPLADSVTECSHNCYGNGECVAGSCHCFPGFIGPYCSRGNYPTPLFPAASPFSLTSDTSQKNKKKMRCIDEMQLYTASTSVRCLCSCTIRSSMHTSWANEHQLKRFIVISFSSTLI